MKSYKEIYELISSKIEESKDLNVKDKSHVKWLVYSVIDSDFKTYTELYELISAEFDKSKELLVLDKMIARSLVGAAMFELMEQI